MARLTWLHLSDLHFGNPKDTWDAESIRHKLLEDLHFLENEKGLQPDLLFFTGDLAFGHLGSGPGQSLTDQYKGAARFLDAVRTAFKKIIPKDRVFLVPGNHDVNRTRVGRMNMIIDSLKRQDAISDFMAGNDDDWKRTMDRLADYRQFLRNSGYIHLLQDEHRLTYGINCRIRDLAVGVGGFNTVWSSGRNSAEERGKLRIGWKYQATRLEKEIRDAHVKIALFHHPLSWGCDADNAFADRSLRNQFHFILTGHEHRTMLTPYADGHADIASYACYHRTHGSGYNMVHLDFENRQGRVWLRKYSTEDGGGWVNRVTPRTDEQGRYPLEHLEKWMNDPGEKEPATDGADPEPNPTGPEAVQQLSIYKERAFGKYEKLPMLGFGTRLRISLRIEDIYMPLQAVVDEAAFRKECFADAEDARKCLDEKGMGNEISVPEAFRVCREKDKRGIVILGDPGSGKTTHLKRLLLWTLSREYSKSGLPEETIPVFLPLRELKTRDLQLFIRESLSDAGLEMPHAFTDDLLAAKPILLLFDGLDEVRDTALRAAAVRQIEALLASRSNLHAAVTCRFAGYTRKTHFNEEFLELHLRPLTRGQAGQFIHTWYTLVETADKGDTDQARTVAGEKAGQLTEILNSTEFRARRVFEMTRNPLLLTNLCLVHRDQGKLPKTRGRLYKESIDVLLELWHGAQGMETPIDADTGRRILQPAAYWMHQEENRVRATGLELEKILDPVLEKVKWPHGTARDFLRLVRDDSGLLTGWGSNTFGFMHLGFQEYLAARHIRNRSFDDPDILSELAARFGESWWTEVILLLLGLEEPSRFKPFMDALVKQPAFAHHPELVDLCFDDAAEISLEPFLNLLGDDPGQDPEKWTRQAAALRILQARGKALLDGLKGALSDHPSKEIRNRFRQTRQVTAKDGDVLVHGPAGYELVKIPAGTFMMGSSGKGEFLLLDESPVHEVSVLEFYMGRYPVTNQQYGIFLEANPEINEPELWGNREYNGPTQPVVGVSWHDVVAFAQWSGLVLPSEAQWEYACRAGTKTRFHTGDSETDLDRAGWYEKNSEERLHPVGEKEPNNFGLYDMHGNVWEWCLDHAHKNYDGAPNDGNAWLDSDDDEGSGRVLRGGSFLNRARRCRTAYRNDVHPSYRNRNIGFRLALLPGRQAQQAGTGR